jgi:ABC-type phosphate transport system substrate-binding protein
MTMKKLVYLFLCVTALAVAAPHAHAQLVIANPSVKSADVSKGDLRDVFTGTSTTLKDGSHVVPVLLKGGEANDAFLSAFIGKGDAAFRAGWRSLVFSGQATMPKTVDSEAAMAEYVAKTPGAIGYVGKSAAHEGVKVLAIK